MKTPELLQKIDIPLHKVYYIEQKGYITSQRTPIGDLEARQCSSQDVAKVRLIWKRLEKGSNHKASYRKALKENNSGETL